MSQSLFGSSKKFLPLSIKRIFSPGINWLSFYFSSALLMNVSFETSMRAFLLISINELVEFPFFWGSSKQNFTESVGHGDVKVLLLFE